MTTLEMGLAYLRHGFSVIPLRPMDKRPTISWGEFQTRRATEAEIRAWWARVRTWSRRFHRCASSNPERMEPSMFLRPGTGLTPGRGS